MKKFIQNLFAILILAVSLCFFFNSNTQASSIDAKADIIVIRTIENGVHYIEVYSDSGTLILKFEEL